MSDRFKWCDLPDRLEVYCVMDANGIEHYFTSKKELQKFIEENDVLEWTSEGPRVRKRKGVLK